MKTVFFQSNFDTRLSINSSQIITESQFFYTTWPVSSGNDMQKIGTIDRELVKLFWNSYAETYINAHSAVCSYYMQHTTFTKS